MFSARSCILLYRRTQSDFSTWIARGICFPLFCFCFLILMGEVTLLSSSDSGFPSHLATVESRRSWKGALCLMLDYPAPCSGCKMTALISHTHLVVVLAHTHWKPWRDPIYLFSNRESFQVDKMTYLQIIVRKGLDKCIAINNYQETHSGKDHGQIFTPKDLSRINLDWLNNPLVLT